MENHFATLNLLDSDGDWKLTETISYSKLPSSRQIDVKQMYESKSQPNLVRQYKCKQVFNSDTNARELEASNALHNDRYLTKCQTAESYSDLYKASSTQFFKGNILRAPKFVLSATSNDVQCDQSITPLNESTFSFCSSSANTDRISTGKPSISTKSSKLGNEDLEMKHTSEEKNTNKGTYKDIKKKFRPLVPRKKKFTKSRINMCYCTCLTVCVIPVVTIIFSLLINLNTFMICDRAELFSNASIELQQKIYGQQNAVSSIVSYLDHDYFYVKVLCLIGGTGVGKSYSIEIIRRNFPSQNKIFLLDMALQHSVDINSFDSYDLIIIENLKMKHLNNFADIMDVIPKMNKCLTVIAVFNIEEINNDLERKVDLVESRNSIHLVLAKKKIDFSIVPYEPLTEGTLELCIIQAALNSGLTPTRDQVNEIKQNLLSSGAGCKGAYAKLQVVSRH